MLQCPMSQYLFWWKGPAPFQPSFQREARGSPTPIVAQHDIRASCDSAEWHLLWSREVCAHNGEGPRQMAGHHKKQTPPWGIFSQGIFGKYYSAPKTRGFSLHRELPDFFVLFFVLPWSIR